MDCERSSSVSQKTHFLLFKTAIFSFRFSKPNTQQRIKPLHNQIMLIRGCKTPQSGNIYLSVHFRCGHRDLNGLFWKGCSFALRPHWCVSVSSLSGEQCARDGLNSVCSLDAFEKGFVSNARPLIFEHYVLLKRLYPLKDAMMPSKLCGSSCSIQ